MEQGGNEDGETKIMNGKLKKEIEEEKINKK